MNFPGKGTPKTPFTPAILANSKYTTDKVIGNPSRSSITSFT